MNLYCFEVVFQKNFIYFRLWMKTETLFKSSLFVVFLVASFKIWAGLFHLRKHKLSYSTFRMYSYRSSYVLRCLYCNYCTIQNLCRVKIAPWSVLLRPLSSRGFQELNKVFRSVSKYNIFKMKALKCILRYSEQLFIHSAAVLHWKLFIFCGNVLSTEIFIFISISSKSMTATWKIDRTMQWKAHKFEKLALFIGF